MHVIAYRQPWIRHERGYGHVVRLDWQALCEMREGMGNEFGKEDKNEVNMDGVGSVKWSKEGAREEHER